jgi:eukaryotic-like serine/threonine-protein kinase
MGNGDDEVVNRDRARAQSTSNPQPSSQAVPFVMPFEEGQVIAGKYEIVGLIGVGGLGFVVSANHIELGEKVALKFLRPEALANEEAVGRFAHEARASAQIKSEHVARVFDVGSLPDGAPFIVMEYLEGCDLSVVLHQHGPLQTSLAVDYILQTCEALAAAHASGVVHRDIKPENLFLMHRAQGMDTIKVLDFGISKVALRRTGNSTRHPLVQTTMAMGSPIYMSPEQLRASRDIDARTDIWSVGCVLFELLTNRLAFDAPSITHVTAVILENEPPSLRAVAPSLHPGLETIIQRCLAKNPSERFQDVGELAIALYPYAPAHGRFSVERVCAILRSAGLTTSKLELQRYSSEPPSAGLPDGVSALPDGVSALPDGGTTLPRGVVRKFSDRPAPSSADATASTPTVETPISRAAKSLSSSRSVVFAVSAAALAGVLFVLGLERTTHRQTDAAASAQPAAVPLPPPEAPKSAPATSTPARVDTAPGAPAPASAAPPIAAGGAASSHETKPDEPAESAKAEPPAAHAEDAASNPSRAEPDPAAARPAASKPAATSTPATPKRRAPTPAPRPTPIVTPRAQQPAASNEPDVGF